ncbi:MAG: TrkA C-terminal domain-containing protein, partial [Butyricicoccaceae bacterium]
LRAQLGLSLIINPDLEAAREITRLLRLPTALSINSFARGLAEIVKFKVTEESRLNGMKLSLLGTSLGRNILVCGVERDGQLTIPDGSVTLQAQDEISFIATPDNSQLFFEVLGMETQQVRSTMIIGGGKSSFYLAKQLLAMGIQVKIIERNRARCEELAMLLPDATIICGDGSDQDLLQEEGINRTESFVALTGIDEENILLTLYAKRIPNVKVVTKINRITFNDVIDSLELGSVIYPRYMTAETIIGYVRALQNSIGSNIETLYHIFDDRAEAIEFHVGSDSPVVGVPLKDLKTKDNLLITCINRQGDIIIPRGMDMIQTGDTVVIVTTHTGFRDIQDILKK